MPRALGFVCAECAVPAPRWSGRCAGCGAWNTLGPRPAASAAPSDWPQRLVDVDAATCRPRPTGVGEVDRVLSGGLAPGSVTLCYGEPGVGKSTLALQILAAVAAAGGRVLVVAAEESAAQVRARAARLGPVPDTLLVAATADLGEAQSVMGSAGAEVVVVDSVQALSDPEVSGAAGSPTQVRAVAERLGAVARAGGPALLLVGQVTKDGDPAGPRALEHLVDTVVSVEGDRHHTLRLLRAVKHRHGPVGEVGVFEMTPEGLLGVDDPGPLLLGDRRAEVAGSAVAPLLHGRRPLLAEVQALTAPVPPGAAPRRSTRGVDRARLDQLLAVLRARAAVDLTGCDVYASVAGGLRAAEPALDLPLALALVSAHSAVALSERIVAMGEVGLAGEVRSVPGAAARLAEAGRLGFATALVPPGTPGGPSPRRVEVATVAEALAAAGLDPDGAPGGAGTMAGWSTARASR